MITIIGVGALLASLIVTPASGFPLPRGGGSQWFGGGESQAAPSAVATHATKGVVKSIDTTSLVITRSTRRTKEQTFAVDAATRQVGRVTVGATVEIRYRTEDGHRIATVVSVQEPGPPR